MRLAVALGLLAATSVQAQGWPDRPLRFVVAYAPGGPADILARQIAQKLTDRLGQQVVVDNRPGAGGNIAAVAVARAAPDGYTLFQMTSTQAANMTLYLRPGYDVMRDFVHVTNVVSYPNLVVVNAAHRARTLAEFIAHAKANPGKVTFGSAGTGGGAHLCGETLKALAGIDLVHVPYKGQAPAVVDLLSGQIDMTFVGVSAAMPHLQAGKLRPLAITSARRLPVVADVPTVAESGVPGYEVVSWLGASLPAGTPSAIAERLNSEIRGAVSDTEFAERLRRDGGEPVVSSAAEFTRFIADDVGRWRKIINDAGLKPE